jgi:hypothetical protein
MAGRKKGRKGRREGRKEGKEGRKDATDLEEGVALQEPVLDHGHINALGTCCS